MKRLSQIASRYQFLEKIGTGGMAEVFKAQETLEDGSTRVVAIKRLYPRLAADKEFVGMFVNEARIATGMSHPNIVPTYDLVNTGSYYYIIMEYLAGKDLEELLTFSPPGKMAMSLEEIAYVVHEIALGLGYAHRGGANTKAGPVIHRDITPGNIMIDNQGRVMVTDFGIARAAQYAHSTRPGVLKGKYEYMAPEYIKGEKFDGRADLFSLGVVFYELLSGENPFVALLPQDIWDKVLLYKPPSLSQSCQIPKSVDAVIKLALQKDPKKRIATGEEFAKLVEPFIGSPEKAIDLLSKRVMKALTRKKPQESFEDMFCEQDDSTPFEKRETVQDTTAERRLNDLLKTVEPKEVPRPDFSKAFDHIKTRKTTVIDKIFGEGDNRVRKVAINLAGLLAGSLLFWMVLPGPIGYLSVLSDIKSEVLIDGVSVGYTPVEKITLETGRHLVEVRKSDNSQVKKYRRTIRNGNTSEIIVAWSTPAERNRNRKRTKTRKAQPERAAKDASTGQPPKKPDKVHRSAKKQSVKKQIDKTSKKATKDNKSAQSPKKPEAVLKNAKKQSLKKQSVKNNQAKRAKK